MKEENKRKFLFAVGKDMIKRHFEGIEEGCSLTMEEVAYMSIPRLKKEFRELLKKEK